MKKGKIVYRSGRLTATALGVTPAIIVRALDDEEGSIVLGHDDVKDLRELVRQLRTYEVGQ